MFKQLQELQRQTKVQELNNGRQLNVMNQLSSMQNKQSSGPQFGMTNYGIPVRDPSQMFKFVDTKLGHRVSNQLAFSETQNQGISGISSSQHFPFQWPSRDSLGSLTKSKSQLAGTYNKSLLVDQFNASSSEKAATLDPLEQKILFNTGDTSENWSALMQTAVADTSSSDDGTHKNDNALTPSFDNNSRSPYIGFRFGSSSQSQLVNHFDPSRITEHKMSTHNPLPNQNLSYSGSRHATFDSNVSQETPQIVAVKKEVDQRWSTTRSTNLRADVGFKNENVYYENKVPQVISLFQVNPAYGNRISQPSDQLAKKSTQAPVNPEKNGDMANKDVTVSKSKKRKFCNFECLPWHKEVTEGCSRLHDTSTTELEWAESAGRLPERLKEFEKLMVSRKRRLVMTTQLLQLLFRPAPAVILSEDATAHCDSVTYYAAKLALGDACSLCLALRKKRTSNSSNDQNLSKLIEIFVDRSKRLQEEFSRFEKPDSTIREVQMDFQDLEKFAVLSRFAKFHTRVALMKRDTESSGAASSKKPKLYPQKYVKAVPMPDTVPEVQKCLSL